MSGRKELLKDLMQDLHAIHKRMFKTTHRKPRLAPSQLVALHIIGHHTNYSVKDIAEKMQMTSSAATQIVEKLVQHGYVVRKESPDDRRAVVLSLSKKTAAEVAALKKQGFERMIKIVDVLTDEEFEQFVLLHKKLVNSLKGDSL